MVGEELKQKAGMYVDAKMIASVLAAGALLGISIWGLRKVGMKKAAAVVAKVK